MLLLYRLFAELVLSIPCINYNGSVCTTGFRGMQKAIDIAISIQVLDFLLLSCIYFGVNQLYEQRAMRPATPALQQLLWALSL